MTSSSWSNLLYPKQAPLLWGVSLLTAVLLLLFVHITHNGNRAAAEQGQALAETVASLSVQAFVTHDRIALGMLSNRIAALGHVSGVTISAADRTPLAQTHDNPVGTSYQAPVTLDDAVVGYATVTLTNHGNQGAPGWRHWVFGITLALIIPMLLQVLRLALPQRGARARAVSVDIERPQATQAYVITANLFDQMRLTNAATQMAQSQAYAWAQDIAMLYNGKAETLSHGAVRIVFADQGEDDRCFAALCAGYLWSDCLRLGELPGAYRLSGHLINTNAQTAEAAQADALLLAAAAQNCEMVISDRLLATLQRPDRVELTPLTHPLHEDLQTAGAGLHRVLGLGSRYAALLARQLERLNRQPEATESLSTF